MQELIRKLAVIGCASSKKARSGIFRLSLGLLALLVHVSTCQAFELVEDFLWIYDSAGATYQPHLKLSTDNYGSEQSWRMMNNYGRLDFYYNNETRPFGIDAGALSNSLQIGHYGNVGVGTGSPRTSLHVKGQEYSSTVLRLESNDFFGSYPSLAWDVSAEIAGFSIKDVGDPDDYYDDLNPMFIETGTPTDTLYMSSLGEGHVGIGTSQPDVIGTRYMDAASRHLNLKAAKGNARLITQGQTAAESYLVHNGGPTGGKVARTRVASGRYVISTMKDDLSGTIEPDAFSIALATGNVGIKTATSKYPLQVGDRGQKDGNGAYVSTGGVWTNACSRAVKDHIEPITLEQARDTVRALQPVGYHYKNEPGEHYCGFIAEDVPDLVATKDRQSLACMDIVSVLTRVVQDQDRQLEEAAKRDERQRQMIDRQQEMLASMHERLLKLEENGATQSSRHAEVIARNSRP